MTNLTYPLPDQIIDKLNPILQRLLIELGAKEVNYGEDFTEFVYKGQKVKIKITING